MKSDKIGRIGSERLRIESIKKGVRWEVPRFHPKVEEKTKIDLPWIISILHNRLLSSKLQHFEDFGFTFAQNKIRSPLGKMKEEPNPIRKNENFLRQIQAGRLTKERQDSRGKESIRG